MIILRTAAATTHRWETVLIKNDSYSDCVYVHTRIYIQYAFTRTVYACQIIFARDKRNNKIVVTIKKKRPAVAHH